MVEHDINNADIKSMDLDTLIAKSKEGKLSQGEINEAVEELDFDNDSLYKFYDALEDSGIPLPDDISSSEMSEIESEVEAFRTGETMEKK